MNDLAFLSPGRASAEAVWRSPLDRALQAAPHEISDLSAAGKIEIRGDHIQIYWNGKRVLEHHDTTFADAGRTGVWTKADSITYFDDLKTEPL